MPSDPFHDFLLPYILIAWNMFWAGVLIAIAIIRLATDRYDPWHTKAKLITPATVTALALGIVLWFALIR
jgi:hypothetical protein